MRENTLKQRLYAGKAAFGVMCTFPSPPVVEIPVDWILDDAPYFMFTGQRSIQAPGPVLQGWLTEFAGIAEVHGVTNFTFHPQISGRPSRLACLRELIDHVRHTPRVWIATLGDIAAYWRTRPFA
jgi:hypothetical protein